MKKGKEENNFEKKKTACQLIPIQFILLILNHYYFPLKNHYNLQRQREKMDYKIKKMKEENIFKKKKTTCQLISIGFILLILNHYYFPLKNEFYLNHYYFPL